MIFAGALVIGTCIGVLTGMFGVGGGFLITPLLNIVLGVPMPIAAGTGAMQILGVSTAGLFRRRGEGHADYKMALVLFGGNYVGVSLGVRTLGWLKGLGRLSLAGGEMAAVDFYLLWVFLVLLGGIAAWLLYDTGRSAIDPETRVGLFSAINIPPYTDFPSLDRPRLSIPVMAYFGLLLGFMTGLLGIGGGVILLPALLYLVGMRTHRATATSLVMVWLTSFVATLTQTLAGNTDLTLAIPLLLGGSLGLQLGCTIAGKLGGGKLRRYFSFVVLAAMALVAARLVAVYS